VGRRIVPFLVAALPIALSCENDGTGVATPERVARVVVVLEASTIQRGSHVAAHAQVFDADGRVLERVVQWSSGDPAVAVVTEGSLSVIATVHGVTPGETTVIATSDDVRGSAAVSVVNPTPAITAVLPSRVQVGASAPFEIELVGSGFVPETAARWNGDVRPTTVVDATRLRMRLDAADLAAAGHAMIDVMTPAPGGGISPAVQFSIEHPAPALRVIRPESAEAGGPAFELTVVGSRFVEGAVVHWNDTALPTAFVSDGELHAQIPANLIAVATLAAVLVSNPSPSAGASESVPFPVNWAVPVLASLSPANALAGTAGLTLRVNGGGFGSATVVRINGSDRPTTFVSATSLDIVLAAADLAVEGTIQVTVFSPAPGGGESDSLPFRITTLPVMQLDPREIQFNGIEKGPNPAPRSAFITVAGDGRVTGLTADVLYGNGQPAGWLALSLSSSVSPATLTVSVNATGLNAGTHHAVVRVGAADAANSPVDIPVDLALAAQPPALSVSPGSVDRILHQGMSFFFPEPQDTVLITNAGGGTIDGLAVNLTHIQPCSFGWISASLTSTTAPAKVVIEYHSQFMCWSFFPTTNLVELEITSTTPGIAPDTVRVAVTSRPADYPQVTTLPATDITATSAVVRGDLVGTGIYGVLFTVTNDTIAGTSGATVPIEAVVNSQTITVPVTGLLPGTKYFYWMAAGDYGECNCLVRGNILTFTTPEPSPAAGASGGRSTGSNVHMPEPGGTPLKTVRHQPQR